MQEIYLHLMFGLLNHKIKLEYGSRRHPAGRPGVARNGGALAARRDGPRVAWRATRAGGVFTDSIRRFHLLLLMQQITAVIALILF